MLPSLIDLSLMLLYEDVYIAWNLNIYSDESRYGSCVVDIFKALAKEYRGENIGVIVSGPQGMQLDVAKECKRQTKFFGVDNTSNVFHYHSVSFEI